MKQDLNEVQRRSSAGLAAIKQMMDRGEGEFSVALFVSHHLDEVEADYWKARTGSPCPDAKRVLDLLVLQKHWGLSGDGGIDEDGIDVFDFTLPGEVTDYVLSVRFDDNGEIADISMES